MPKTTESSIAEKYSNRTAQHTYMVSFDAQSSNTTINFSHSIEADNASQAVGREKSARIVCTDRKNVYFCIGKLAIQCTRHIYSPHIGGVLGSVSYFGAASLPKHKRASLFLYTYIN